MKTLYVTGLLKKSGYLTNKKITFSWEHINLIGDNQNTFLSLSLCNINLQVELVENLKEKEKEKV